MNLGWTAITSMEMNYNMYRLQVSEVKAYVCETGLD